MVWKGLQRQWENVVKMKIFFMKNAKTHTFPEEVCKIDNIQGNPSILQLQTESHSLHEFHFLPVCCFFRSAKKR